MDTWASSILHNTTCVDLDLRIDVVTVDLDLRPPLRVRLLRRLRWVGVCVSFSSKPSNNNESHETRCGNQKKTLATRWERTDFSTFRMTPTYFGMCSSNSQSAPAPATPSDCFY